MFYLQNYSFFKRKYSVALFFCLLLCIAIFIHWNTKNQSHLKNISNENVQNDIKRLKQKLSTPPSVQTSLLELEKYTQENGIMIKTVKQYQHNIYLLVQSSETKVLEFLSYCESFSNYSKIESIKFSKDGDSTTVEIKLSFKTYYLKEKRNKKHTTNDSLELLKLQAIVSNYVIINDTLLQLDDEIDEFRITHIGKEQVVLQYQEQYHMLRLFDEIE